MRHGAGIFAELVAAQIAHHVDAAHGAGAGRVGQVLAEFLIAKYRQPFFQAQLEPVAAGHAVACPVVEIFVADDAFNAVVVAVGCGRGFGQHVLGVENIQTLVFHGAHIEVAHGHNHEAFQIQRQAKARLIPADAVDKRLHGVLGFIQIAGAHIHLQHMLVA